ncbi:hypothetical protein OG407_48445 [Streptomyces sp. NBC_01515]|uniref:hypothetical protein n=1 Tax=Streptomyces sp. NBC_01515 TaxID=2903890 RepID=UPI00386AB844
MSDGSRSSAVAWDNVVAENLVASAMARYVGLSAARRDFHNSTVCGVLRARGYVGLDADEGGFSRWIDRAEGEVVADPP